MAFFEVFYDENGLMKAHSKDSLTAMCDDIEDLKYELEVIGRAFELETLEYQSDEEEDTDEEEEDEYGFNDFR